ncbi:restriction endonuclease [Sphingomonas kyeonggiensis]|uniref:Restriction endonuclease type IV Mrr domain-containing protein n=1 Tax=Sphingomonas kyeonggiensis TaxID=1268553 RepID=A0A7W6JWC0_9SPHN|nr:restriction endonuclease [Sphingomonas kyeonggiensis]MBB4100753.1 hypothetical protein [Sphingomonas kyeonggiensis]
MDRNDGKDLEQQVANLVEGLIASGDLPYRPELVRFREKAKYYSRTREAEVDFENVLEVYVKDNMGKEGAQPTHVIVFECKDHGRAVEVKLIDELVGRLAGGYGFNMKGYVVTRKGFQSGALATARNNGIGLIKIMPDDKIKFFAHLQTIVSIERDRREFPRRAQQALLNPNYESGGESFYAADDGYVFSSLAGVLGRHFREAGLEAGE